MTWERSEEAAPRRAGRCETLQAKEERYSERKPALERRAERRETAPPGEEQVCPSQRVTSTAADTRRGFSRQNREELRAAASDLASLSSNPPQALPACNIPCSRREAVVLSLRKRINGILMELEEKPDDSMEVETTVECALTNDDLQRLKDFTERLERILADVISSCTALRTRLHVLWRQLDVGEDERASIAAPTAGTTERVHQLLVDEFGRLAEMRRARLGDVISRVKEGIVLEWERCCYGDSQKQAFVPFHDDYVSEERLLILEQELERLKSEFDARQDLYLGLAHWDRMWQQFTEMERRAGDPARLTNRGGALLREEKEWKRLKRELSKLESELSAGLVGRAIFPWGKPFPELLACCWATLKEEREKEKQERQLKRAQILENEVVFRTFLRTPGKRRGRNATPPGKCRTITRSPDTDQGASRV
uniref:protein regulator of cytokinesis 1-like isoform X1 n=1 Tax=Myxine glutinosa TaxID=7769 RepID=UPI00358E61DF